MRLILIYLSTIFMILVFSGCDSNEAKTIVEDNKSFNELKSNEQ